MQSTMKQAVSGIAITLSFLLGWLWAPFFWLGLIGLGAVLYQNVWVVIPEWHIGVVYSRERQAFARLLPAGRHLIWPGLEQLRGTIATVGQSAQAVTAVQSRGGLSLKVEWSVSYSLEPERLPATKQSQLALKLVTKSGLILRKYATNGLRHIAGDLSLDELSQPGSHARLERELRQQLRTQLTDLGFNISKVMIGQIQLPANVLAALEAAHEKELQAEQEARTLARLHEVISQFSEADMQRLMELERIHKLGQNGVALLYPAAASATGLDSVANWPRPATRLPTPHLS